MTQDMVLVPRELVHQAVHLLESHVEHACADEGSKLADALEECAAAPAAPQAEPALWSILVYSDSELFTRNREHAERAQREGFEVTAFCTAQPTAPQPEQRSAWVGSIPAEESDQEFAAQIAAMDAKQQPEQQAEHVGETKEQQ